MPLLRKHFRRPKPWSEPDSDPEFQVAPIADLLLVLVVFFMSITSTEFFHTDHLVHLPRADTGIPRQKEADEVILDVTWARGLRSGSIKFENQILAQPALLVPLLETRLQFNPATKILIRADKEVEYSFIASILQACRQAQISNVVFSVFTETPSPRSQSDN